MVLDPALVAWRSRFQVVKPTAQYDPNAGLVKAWRANADAWGPPIEVSESVVTHTDGRALPARTFLYVGLVVWVPENGAQVVGWPVQ